MSELRTKQSRFMHMQALLVLHAEQLGYETTGGDLYRDARCDYGHPASAHRSRLAIDLYLFKEDDGPLGADHHQALHDYWDSIGGSERIAGDMNHYSLEHNGVR